MLSNREGCRRIIKGVSDVPNSTLQYCSSDYSNVEKRLVLYVHAEVNKNGVREIISKIKLQQWQDALPFNNVS